MFLKTNNISKSFLGNQILYDINLEIEQGRVLGLIGPNGSGKSTVVSILSGIHSQDSGEIIIEGNCVEKHTPESALQKGIFTLYQEPQLIRELSIEDNLFVGIYEKKYGIFCDTKKMRKRTEEILRYFGSGLSPETEVGKLTKCEKEIVAVARAFLRKAKLYIMDEPTAGMSDEEQKVVLNLVKSIKKSGASVLYITHRLEELRVVCDQIGIMRDGHMILNSPIGEVSDNCIENLMQVTNIKEAVNTITSSSEKILEVKALSLEGIYENISFSLRKGEILGIAGDMGSGRTALLKTLFGALKPTSGDIVIKDKKVVLRDIYDALKNNIGYMPDDRLESGIMPDLSVLDNAIVAKDSREKTFLRNRKKELESFIQCVVQPGYYLFSPSQAIKYSSGGNQQKTIFFRWIISNSQILLLDEPTKGIDIVSKNEMYQLIFEKAQEGVSFIISSSDYKELEKLCTRILSLSRGYIK